MKHEQRTTFKSKTYIPLERGAELCPLSLILDGALVTTLLACRDESREGVQTR